MAHLWPVLTALGVLSVIYTRCNAEIRSKNLKHITEGNWRDILEGEWMLEFHAPWCPACKDLHKAWSAFADWTRDVQINVGEINVTENPGLTGRFLITSLPTIYHVKDGVFRVYGGPRDTEDFIWFVEESKWSFVDPISSWKHPDSIQMSMAATCFKLSMAVRDLHSDLVQNYGVPGWASFCIFAGITLLMGSILAVVIVHMIDRVFPTKPAPAGAASAGTEGKKQRKKEKQKQQRDATKKSSRDESEKEKKSSDMDGWQDSQTESQLSQSEEEGDNGNRKKDNKTMANGKAASSPSAQKRK